jgi:glyoxalase/bleomycin resistance protein/dioxygenase superfamily protein
VRRSVMRRCLKGLGGFPTSTDGFILGPSHGIVGRLDFSRRINSAVDRRCLPSWLMPAGPATWVGIAMQIKISGLTPLIQVFDMPTSVAFYRDVLGFELVMSSRPGEQSDWALLQSGRRLVDAEHGL